MDVETLTLAPPASPETFDIEGFTENMLELDDIDFRADFAEVLNTDEEQIIDPSPESNAESKVRFLNKIVEKGKKILDKKALSDAVASNIICALMAIPIEMIGAGVDINTFIKGRVGAAIGNSASGGVYGKWRDYAFKKLSQDGTKYEKWTDYAFKRLSPENKIKARKFLNDTIISMGYTAMYSPITAFTMHFAGAETEEIWKSVGIYILSSGVTGRFYGVAMDLIRKRVFKIEAEQAKEQEQESNAEESLQEQKETVEIPNIQTAIAS
jgi:hypothetical protein